MALKLSKKPKEAAWIDFEEMGVSCLCKALDSFVYLEARTRANRIVLEVQENAEEIETYGGLVSNLPDFENPDQMSAFKQIILCMCLAEMTIEKWKGFEEEDEPGVDIEVNTVNIRRAVLQLGGFAEEFVIRYLHKQLERVSVGNDSGTTPDGPLESVPDIAATAEAVTRLVQGDLEETKANDALLSNSHPTAP